MAIAEKRPAMCPVFCTSVTASRTAQGVAVPSRTAGTAKSRVTASSAPASRPGRQVGHAGRRQVEHRRAQQGDQRHGHGRRRQDQVQLAPPWVAVRQPPAQPGAYGQREEDQADQGCPHQLRVAKGRLEQAGGAEFDAERDQADDKDEDG